MSGHDHAAAAEPERSVPFLSAVGFLVALATLWFAVLSLMSIIGPNRDFILTLAIVAAIALGACVLGVVIGVARGGALAIGVIGALLAIFSIVGTVWAYDDMGSACGKGQTRHGLSCEAS